ncbi:zinc finger BED domain-containing protein 5-like [Metopolophium dirhodum]|uniref:zinc finger BED domain-containing protein 5-like n=1 Tax=Metopolophium dirhodum TaxID=44670 RepID=UPI00299073E7|nr:zinc finger BED domain-containing protein 5-like [Metopolophium dirhodum]
MESQFTKLILHTEVRWLSRGKVLSSVHELKNELIVFFTLENVPEFCELLTNEKWLENLSYLADIFSHLNQINSCMQGPNENILTSCRKLFTLKDKLQIWKKRVQKNQFDMFPSLSVTEESSEVMTFIMEHLTALEESIDKYFPNLDIFDLEEEEKLAEIRNNRTHLLKYKNVSLNEFWIQVEKIHAEIGKKLLKILLQFSTSYLCEQGFSTLVNIKSNKRMKMEFIEEEMRVCLSTIRPQIKDLCKKKQAQVSH